MEDCLFCKISRGEIPSWKVFEDGHTFAFLDISPKNKYHTLVIPKNHYENIFDIPEAEAVHLMKTIKKISDLYSSKLGLNDLNIINNSGKNARQEVMHLHFHIVPRYPGDGQDFTWPSTRTELCGQLEELAKFLGQ